MRKLAAITLYSLFGVLAVNTAVWAEGPSNLEELLEQVKQSQTQSAEVNKQRERAFDRARDQRKALLDAARKEYADTEKQARRARAKLDDVEAELQALQKELDEQSGDLRDLFTVARSIAADLSARMESSLTRIGGDERLSQVQAISSQQGVLDSESLRALWLLMQEEATALGKVSQQRVEIIDADGHARSQAVTRIGPFSAFSDAGYVRLENGHLQLLARQPSRGAAAEAQAFANSKEATAPILIDPTRGSILGLLVESPTLFERVEQGGVVGYVILGLGAVGLLIAASCLLLLVFKGWGIKRQAKHPEQPSNKNALGRILAVCSAEDYDDPDTLELKLDEAILREVPRLERGQTTLKLLAAVAPLLGLLGTVVGMIITFQSITLFGTGDPKLMAGGISQALVTTVLGLVVAIPLLFAHALLTSRSKSLLQILEQQSAGLLARVVESKGLKQATAEQQSASDLLPTPDNSHLA